MYDRNTKAWETQLYFHDEKTCLNIKKVFLILSVAVFELVHKGK